MSHCHQMQWLALSHAKSMDSNMAATSGYHIVLIKHLELQLLDLIANFSQWLNAQRKYATYLNEWINGVLLHFHTLHFILHPDTDKAA